MTLELIERGAPVIAAPWCDGRLPPAVFTLHRWSHRDERGLGVTLCGIRQDDRGNGWVLREYANRPWRWPMSSMCECCEAAE